MILAGSVEPSIARGCLRILERMQEEMKGQACACAEFLCGKMIETVQ